MFRLKRSKADKLFSDLVRLKAGYNCERCYVHHDPPTSALHCSHYWGRQNKSVRFNEDNASSLCYGCHRYLGSNPQEHREFMLKKLGHQKLEQLDKIARIPTKVDEELIFLGLEQELKKLKDDLKKNVIGSNG